MKYAVNAMCLNPETGEVIAPPRVEVIDTVENDIFHGCKGPWDVEDRYHIFWNRLDDSWETDFPKNKEKVVVLTVKKV